MINQAINRGGLGALGLDPRPPQTRPIKFKDRESVLASGLYIGIGGTGGGKSIASRAIAIHAVASGWTEVLCLYVYEPGALTIPTKTADVNRELFSDPKEFITAGLTGDIIAYLGSFTAGRDSKSPVALIVVDSIGDAIRAFNTGTGTIGGRKGEGMAEKGQQPSDRLAVVTINNFCVNYAICMIGTVNLDMVPFAENLAAATQGIIKFEGADRFSKNERATNRDDETFLLSTSAVNTAAKSLHYVKSKKTSPTTGTGIVTY